MLVGGAVSELGTKGVDEGLVHARRIWARLWPRIAAREAAVEAVHDVEARPDDSRARGALELQLEKLMRSDPELASEITQLWRDTVSSGVLAVGTRSVAVGGDVSSSVIVTGDEATIREP